MNENNIDKKLKDFSDYLLDIGLLIGTTYNDFKKKYKEINEKEKILIEDEEPDESFELTYFKDNISKTMIKFYSSLSEERKKLITFQIFNIYNKKREGKNNNELNNDNFQIDKNELLLNTEEDNNKEIKELKEEHFEIEILSKKNEPILKLYDSSENSEENFNSIISKKKKKKKEKNNISKKKDNKKKEEKININENCTFQPNLDKKEKKDKKGNKKEKKDVSKIFEKLYKKNLKKEKDIENIRKELDKECSFQPNILINNDKKNKKKRSISRKDFEKRMKLIEENKKEKEEKRKKEEKKEFQEKFPFMPNKEKVNKSFNKSFSQKRNESFSSEDIYKRLYEENKKIKIKYEENVKKMLEDIKERANHPIVNHNNINYLSRRKERKISNMKNMSFDMKQRNFYTEEKKEDMKIFNNKRIEELYEEYKKMKNGFKTEQTINNIDNIDNEINSQNEKENKEKSKKDENESNISENNEGKILEDKEQKIELKEDDNNLLNKSQK